MEIQSAVDINNTLNEIWKKELQSNNPISPLLAPVYINSGLKPENCNFLVIGINPSFSLKGLKSIFQDVAKNNYNDLSFFRQNTLNKIHNNGLTEQLLNEFFMFNQEHCTPEDFGVLENKAFEDHSYFKKMHETARYVFGEKAVLHHLDIFYYRETNQHTLKTLINNHTNFFNQQKELSYDIIKWLKPKMILIANAYAGEVFKEIFNKRNQAPLSMDSTTGTFKIEWDDEASTHAFFSGMLSGQRALDLGSYERLKWHMKAINEGKMMKL